MICKQCCKVLLHLKLLFKVTRSKHILKKRQKECKSSCLGSTTVQLQDHWSNMPVLCVVDMPVFMWPSMPFSGVVPQACLVWSPVPLFVWVGHSFLGCGHPCLLLVWSPMPFAGVVADAFLFCSKGLVDQASWGLTYVLKCVCYCLITQSASVLFKLFSCSYLYALTLEGKVYRFAFLSQPG